MKSLIKFLPVLAAAYLSTSLSAQAVLINVNFGSSAVAFSGAGVVGTVGDKWNNVTNSSYNYPSPNTGGPISLSDSANDPSGVSLSYNILFGYTAPATDTPFTGTAYESLMRGFFGIQGSTPGTISLTGLAAGQYALYLYSAADNGLGQQARTTTFTANGVTADVGPNSGASTLIENTNYLKLNLTVLNDGLLNISFVNPNGSGVPGPEGDINGFQLQSIPEPSAAALLGVGLVTMVLIRRRQTNPALS